MRRMQSGMVREATPIGTRSAEELVATSAIAESTQRGPGRALSACARPAPSRTTFHCFVNGTWCTRFILHFPSSICNGSERER
mmetsp:Transcript_19826/g.41016  ORF Transcript_19826/g.41016 Transcript_19826/m.41016 type:complete len:83 (-) Transcript_19826:1413-1661(-)